MTLYALIAGDRDTGVETVSGFRRSEKKYGAADVKSFPDCRLMVRPVERITPTYDQNTEKLEGQTYEVLVDRVVARDLVVPDRDRIDRQSVKKQVADQATVIDALISIVDMVVARTVQRGGLVADEIFPVTALKALTAYRDNRVTPPADPRPVGAPPSGWPQYPRPVLTPGQWRAIREIIDKPPAR
jgi:hypothetical protein